MHYQTLNIGLEYGISKIGSENPARKLCYVARLREFICRTMLCTLSCSLMIALLSATASAREVEGPATASGANGTAVTGSEPDSRFDSTSGSSSSSNTVQISDSSSADSSSADSSSAATNSASPSSTNSDSSSSSTKIKTGVQMIELNLQVLRDVGLDIKNIIKAASSLYDEVTIQPVTLMTEPEVVGMGTIINIPVGFTPTGAGPQPSKKRVDLAMGQMRPIIEIMKGDVDDFESGRKRLDISDAEREQLKPLLDEWIELVNGISTKLTSLEGITKSRPYDNNAIANLAGGIHKDCKRMDEVRRKLYKDLQKAGKRKSKSA